MRFSEKCRTSADKVKALVCLYQQGKKKLFLRCPCKYTKYNPAKCTIQEIQEITPYYIILANDQKIQINKTFQYELLKEMPVDSHTGYLKFEYRPITIGGDHV